MPAHVNGTRDRVSTHGLGRTPDRGGDGEDDGGRRQDTRGGGKWQRCDGERVRGSCGDGYSTMRQQGSGGTRHACVGGVGEEWVPHPARLICCPAAAPAPAPSGPRAVLTGGVKRAGSAASCGRWTVREPCLSRAKRAPNLALESSRAVARARRRRPAHARRGWRVNHGSVCMMPPGSACWRANHGVHGRGTSPRVLRASWRVLGVLIGPCAPPTEEQRQGPAECA